MEAVPVSTRVAAPLVAQALAAVLVAEVLLAAMGQPAGGFGSSPVDDADYGSGISADGYGYGRATIIAEIWIVAATIYQTAKIRPAPRMKSIWTCGSAIIFLMNRSKTTGLATSLR